MTTTYDFGSGPVPATKLENGTWVADSAKISAGAKIGDMARIDNYARIGVKAEFNRQAMISDRAVITDRAVIGAEPVVNQPSGARRSDWYRFPIYRPTDRDLCVTADPLAAGVYFTTVFAAYIAGGR